jgi:hypothetical protein
MKPSARVSSSGPEGATFDRPPRRHGARDGLAPRASRTSGSPATMASRATAASSPPKRVRTVLTAPLPRRPGRCAPMRAEARPVTVIRFSPMVPRSASLADLACFPDQSGWGFKWPPTEYVPSQDIGNPRPSGSGPKPGETPLVGRHPVCWRPSSTTAVMTKRAFDMRDSCPARGSYV